MGVTLDSGALTVFQKCLELRSHPLNKHIAIWYVKDIVITTPSIAWAEYWRGRIANDHFISRVKIRVRVRPVSQESAERAAEVLRRKTTSADRNTVKHLIDAMVMTHANEMSDAVYTTDVDDFSRLWDDFPKIKLLINAANGDVILQR